MISIKLGVVGRFLFLLFFSFLYKIAGQSTCLAFCFLFPVQFERIYWTSGLARYHTWAVRGHHTEGHIYIYITQDNFLIKHTNTLRERVAFHGRVLE